MDSLGNVLIVANPTSHSGAGAEAAAVVEGHMEYFERLCSSFELKLTQASGDACAWAAEAAAYDTVLAVGGDGIIHEIVNGLMRISAETRPRMGIIAVGSGNDFARTLGSARNDPAAAMKQLENSKEKLLDLGLVDGETYFMETLSFGLDAAIALDTTKRRSEGTVQKGSLLFASSGVKIMASARKGWTYRVSWTGAAGNQHEDEGVAIAFALQNGPTYGGGFRIAPDARPDDGLLNCCRTKDLPPLPITLGTFAQARFGLHGGSHHLVFSRFKHMEVEFETEPPSQIDGEEIHGTHHVIDVVPQALRVIVP